MTAPVTVTQADREAAAEYHGKVGSTPPAISFIRSRHSDQDSLVQAFARHRQQAEAASAAQVAELVSALCASVSALCSVRKSYAEAGVGLWNDVDAAIEGGADIIARIDPSAYPARTAPDAGGV